MSSPRSGLVPTPIVDKNGKANIVHKKPPGSGASASLPAPAPVAKPASTLPLSSLEHLSLVWRDSRIRSSRYTPDDFHPDAVREIEHVLGTMGDGFGGDYYNPYFRDAVRGALNLMAEEDLPVNFHNLAVFAEQIVPHSSMAPEMYIYGLSEFLDRIEDRDYLLDADEDERRSAQALVRYTAYADFHLGDKFVYRSLDDPEESGPYRYVTPAQHDIGLYVMEHPDRLDDILDLLRRYGSPLPADLLDQQLNHPEQALREGLL